jgi:hypothetical protein
MEENVSTSSGSPHNPISTTTIGGMLPPNPPLSVQTTMVSTPSTSGNGSMLSSTMTAAPFMQSATGPPFSYGMLGFNSNSFLMYSTLHTMDLGAGSSKSPVQGSTRETSVPLNVIPYGGGHIPPLSPSLSGAFQQPIRSNANYILFGEGSLGPSYYTTPVGSILFSLFDTFGNNAFSSAVILAGGNPGFGKHNPV